MKRIFDFVLSLLLIIILSPLLVLIALLIRFESKGNPLFIQKRPGKNHESFTIYKYRTMKIDTPDIPTNEFEDRNKHITKVGKFLRITSLDELPQLFNILKGDMSFVGPRPPLFSQEDLIENREQAGIDKLKPGITGWAQINGRDSMDDYQKFKYDLYYFKNQSFLLDLKIICLTFLKVIKAEGIIEKEDKD